MSDTCLRERPGSHPSAISRQLYDRSPGRVLTSLPNSTRSLSTLPYDVLLNIAELLEPDDVMNLRRTCKSLRDFAQSRAIWLTFAANMLDACKPLPLNGFQRIRDLHTPALSNLIRRGRRLHHIWTQTDPKLIRPYKQVAAPRHEDVVWLSPITSKYTLCCTRTGRVLCWDVGKAECVASWSSGADWEIWKCRVEFEERIVYFAMAKRGVNGFGTDCQLMALHFPGEDNGSEEAPYFSKLTSFCFPGHVISVYLLDPLRRLLSAYIWVERTNHLGLYVLLDWSIPLYVFLNTGISCDPMSREWSCIGYDPENVVIHAEEEVRGYQFFYPYTFLQTLATRTPPPARQTNPPLVPPPRTVSSDFIPTENPFESKFITQSSHFVRQWWPMIPYTERIRRRSCTILLQTMTVPPPAPGGPPLGPHDPPPGTHLFTIAQHYFSIPLRKEQLRWWYIREPFEIVCYPHNPNAEAQQADEEVAIPVPPQVSQQAMAQLQAEHEAAVLDANADDNEDEDTYSEVTQYADEVETEVQYQVGGDADPDSDSPLPLPVPPPADASQQHQAAMAAAAAAEQMDDGVAVVPLVAVDFGCAAWLEYVSFGSDDLRVRYVTFPPVHIDRAADDYVGLSSERDVHTLEVPPEIDLKHVCHIGLDQAQGTIILGMRRSNVYILRYH
ncbi:uncharacterized protein FOMMEDRAFT_16680 [Fomitiporia mediterranea MF3/22]|uniref:uncharacterized protein n=1 Tax=Fomitiporia mediterranea (strain MF3/22) TaxID=694068 RepID=UPI0004407ED7|nr:uncharacterized protein FOMMEDRAFT_16680 [Fomitiporia mediterranea MF3/22]EJD08229.1 hypothetical protein FOMMEDRAFT_16680 [Fomitiporia mediterranea MF3/22]